MLLQGKKAHGLVLARSISANMGHLRGPNLPKSVKYTVAITVLGVNKGIYAHG